MSVCPQGGEWNGSYGNGLVDPSSEYVTIDTRMKLQTIYNPQATNRAIKKFTNLQNQPQDVISVHELCDSYPSIPQGDFTDLYENFSASGEVLLALRKQQLWHQLCRCRPPEGVMIGSCDTPIFELENRTNCWFIKVDQLYNSPGLTYEIDGVWTFFNNLPSSTVWTWDKEPVGTSGYDFQLNIYRDGDVYQQTFVSQYIDFTRVCFYYRPGTPYTPYPDVVETDDPDYPGGDDDVKIIYVPGPVGPEGPQGPQGPQGEKGEPGMLDPQDKQDLITAIQVCNCAGELDTVNNNLVNIQNILDVGFNFDFQANFEAILAAFVTLEANINTSIQWGNLGVLWAIEPQFTIVGNLIANLQAVLLAAFVSLRADLNVDIGNLFNVNIEILKNYIDEHCSGNNNQPQDCCVTKLAVVKFTDLQYPSNFSQFGSSNGQTNIRLGWFSWVLDGHALPKQQINIQNAAFVSPIAGLSDYEYNLFEGVTGTPVLSFIEVDPNGELRSA